MSNIDNSAFAKAEINNIPDGWVETSLGDVCDNVSRRFDFTNKPEVVFINTGDVLNGKFLHSNLISKIGLPGQAKKGIKKGDILFSEIRPKNKRFAIVDFDVENYVVSTKFMVIKRKDLINLDFLYVLLSSDNQINEFNQIAESRSGTFPQITFDSISHLKLLLPSLKEQTAIAKVLNAFDDKIQLLHAQNKTLEALAQTVFKELFFSKNHSSNTVKLGEVIKIRGGFSYKGSDLGKGSSYLLGMGCVSNHKRFLDKGARLYSDNINDTFLIKPGDIVLATRQQSENLPILGYPAILPEDYEGKNVIVGTNLYMVKNNSPFNNEILFLLLKSQEYKNHIINNSKGTTVKMITKDSVETFEFNMPNEESIEEIERLINPMVDKLKRNNQQIQSLNKTKDELLPKLLSGKTRIKEFVK